MHTSVMVDIKRFILPKIGAKSLGNGSQDNCKVSLLASKRLKLSRNKSFVCVPC